MLIAFNQRQGIFGQFLLHSPAVAEGSLQHRYHNCLYTVLSPSTLRLVAAGHTLEQKAALRASVRNAKLFLSGSTHRTKFSANYNLESSSQAKTLLFIPELSYLVP